LGRILSAFLSLYFTLPGEPGQRMGGQRANVSRPFDLDWADLVPVSRPGGGIAVAHLRRYYETGFENKQMPKRLLARWQPESSPEFRASARQRFEEGLALAGLGHRTGAIYLWGYSAEMTLKAAYFGVIGLTEIEVITWPSHIQPAINRGRHVLGIAWPAQGQGHNVRAWAELLVAGRAAIAGAAYVHPSAGRFRRAARTLDNFGAKRCAITRIGRICTS